MTSTEFSRVVIAATAAFLAGGINSVAGGGTLLSFPALVWLGLPSITANATSTVAIWPARQLIKAHDTGLLRSICCIAV